MREAEMFAETFKENFTPTGTTKEKFEQIVRKVLAACDALCQRAQITETLMQLSLGIPQVFKKKRSN